MTSPSRSNFQSSVILGSSLGLVVLGLLLFKDIYAANSEDATATGLVKTYSVSLTDRYLTIEAINGDSKVTYLTPAFPGDVPLVLDQEYNERPFVNELFGDDETEQTELIMQLQGQLCVTEDGRWASTRKSFVSLLMTRIRTCSPLILEPRPNEFHVFRTTSDSCSRCLLP